MRSDAWLMVGRPPLRLLEFNEECLELRGMCVGVDGCGREIVRGVFRGFAFILADAAIAPMNGNADLVSQFAVNLHRLNTPSNHGLGHVFGADAGDFDMIPALDAFFFSQLYGNLNEWLRHFLHKGAIVLSPVMIVLGETVGGADDIVALTRLG